MGSREYERELIQQFNTAYERFVQEHGELYEFRTVPMDDADREKVRKFYRDANIALVVVLSLPLMIYFGYGIYAKVNFWENFKENSSAEGFVITFFAIIFYVAIFAMFHYGRKKTLSNDIKTFIKGVITEKIKKGRRSEYSIKISHKDKVKVTPSEYKEFACGDIVEVEILGNPGGIIVRHGITLIGKVPLSTRTHLPTVNPDHNSAWARAGQYFGKKLFQNKQSL
jgi:hypothetical protein